jgi:hypothetical protein
MAKVAVVSLIGLTVVGLTDAVRADAAAAVGRADATAGAGSAPAGRAMWVWDTSTPAATVDLAVAQGISQLYAAVPPQVQSSPKLAQLTDLSHRAAAAGIRVDALGGDPGWVDNQAWVVDQWLRPALASGLFTGIHVDIEPYTTPAWQTQRAKVVKKYLATYDSLAAAAGQTPIEADIPFWFDEIPANGSTLDREVMRRTDGVAVMAYRNLASGPDGTIALAAKEVTAGAALGVPVRIGQETNPLGTDPSETKQTFAGQTRTQMEVQLAAVTSAFHGSPGFAGLAIHDSRGYAALAP